MATLRFEGYSDDTFGEYAVTNDDFDNCASGDPIHWSITCGNKSMIVVGQYGRGYCGGWMIGVSPFDGDEDPLPPWRIWIEPSKDREYSPALFVKLPSDEFTLKCLERS